VSWSDHSLFSGDIHICAAQTTGGAQPVCQSVSQPASQPASQLTRLTHLALLLLQCDCSCDCSTQCQAHCVEGVEQLCGLQLSLITNRGGSDL
jgi:hypothetical protein